LNHKKNTQKKQKLVSTDNSAIIVDDKGEIHTSKNIDIKKFN